VDAIPECKGEAAGADIICQKRIVRFVMDKLSAGRKTDGIHDEVDMPGAAVMDTKNDLKLTGIETADVISQ